MAATGEYPKANGDVLYGEDVNMGYYQSALGSTLNNGQVTVAATATQIIATNTSRRSLLIKNHGTTVMYVGGANTVTTSNGFRLNGGQSIYFRDQDEVFGIVAAGTETAGYLESE